MTIPIARNPSSTPEVEGYLDELPANAQVRGDAASGTIEILDLLEGAAADAPLGIVYEDNYVLVVRDPVRFPSGATGTYLRIFERSGLDGAAGVVIVAVRDGELYLRRVFRHATRSWELECPRGFREPGETADAAVRRELHEELGIESDRIERLGELVPNSGLLASVVESHFVTLRAGAPDSRPEAEEAFGEVHRVPFAHVATLISSGELRDGISLAAVIQAQARGLLPVHN